MKKTILFFIAALLTIANSFASNNAETTTTAKPVVFKLINGGEPSSLDPSLIQGVPENRIYQSLFEGLVAFNYETARAIPGVAESWTVSDDNIVYTFKLRDTAWNDGVKITAQTFVDSWIRTLDPATAAPYAWFPSMFIKGASDFNAGKTAADSVGVKAIDDLTLEVTLVGPLPYALDAFAHYSFGIVPLHIVAKYGDSWTNVDKIVTNGPFYLKEWLPQDKLVVAKDSKYWDADSVQVDEVVYLPVEDNNTGYSMFLNGEVDWMTQVPADRMKEGLLRDDVFVSPNLATYYYSLNNKIKPLDDVRVRKALSMSINRQQLVDRIGQAGQIASAAMVPSMTGYPALKGNTLNLVKAKELLAEAGFPNGEGFPVLSLLYNTDESHKKMAEFVQQQWKDNLGIDIILDNQEWKTYVSSKNQHDFSIARAGWNGDYQDPNTFLDMFVTGAAMNDMQYENSDYDALINKAAGMSAGADRFDALKEAEEMLIGRDQALLPLYTYVKVNCIDLNKWGGWATNVLDLHPPRQIYKK